MSRYRRPRRRAWPRARHYASLGGKSGGETQELMAFIVGAALRYQLGDEDRRPRFAPVFLDEGFIKSDSEFAGRSVQAWKKLGFQLIVGVPLDKVTALEPTMRLILTVTKSPKGTRTSPACAASTARPHHGRTTRRAAAVKTPEQVVADVTTRLRRSWPHAVAARSSAGRTRRRARSGDSDSSAWPHTFPLGSTGKAGAGAAIPAYQAKTLAWRQWHATQAGARRRSRRCDQARPRHHTGHPDTSVRGSLSSGSGESSGDCGNLA